LIDLVVKRAKRHLMQRKRFSAEVSYSACSLKALVVATGVCTKVARELHDWRPKLVVQFFRLGLLELTRYNHQTPKRPSYSDRVQSQLDDQFDPKDTPQLLILIWLGGQ
jgi:hypothetical protein